MEVAHAIFQVPKEKNHQLLIIYPASPPVSYSYIRGGAWELAFHVSSQAMLMPLAPGADSRTTPTAAVHHTMTLSGQWRPASVTAVCKMITEQKLPLA